MDVTNLITKIFNDYDNANLHVNRALKYAFEYNGYRTIVYYTREDGLKNQLLLAISVGGTDYLTTLSFSECANHYYMNYYLPPEIYKHLKFSILFVSGKCATTPYFEQMRQCIINRAPIVVNHRTDIGGMNLYVHQYKRDNPYFEMTIRKPMSDKMKEKIKCKYDKNLAQAIFDYCGTTMTLRFTADISKSQDICAYINN